MSRHATLGHFTAAGSTYNIARIVGFGIMGVSTLLMLLVVWSIGVAEWQAWLWMLFGAVGILALGAIVWTLGNIEWHFREVRALMEATHRDTKEGTLL
jgi:membrane protein YdbS with pleckstrin-like domain